MTKQKENKVEDIELTTNLKECFIITPIGKNGSSTFAKTEGLINSVLKPVLEQFGFYPLPAHHIDSSGSINKQIIDKIVNCELVIANLTEINPNVMYELAVRHSFGKKVITLAENDTKLPFDIVDQRTIFYEDSMLGADRLKPQLIKAIDSLLKEPIDKNISNPVYDAIKQVAAIHGLPAEQQDALSIVLERLETMDNQLKAINRNKQGVLSTRETNFSNFKAKLTYAKKIELAENLNYLMANGLSLINIEHINDTESMIELKSNRQISIQELENIFSSKGMTIKILTARGQL